MRVMAIIPARGGSKTIINKNIKLLAGKPLIQYAFECALASDVIDRTIISTDDYVIAKVAKDIGIEVPFIRPAEYARDDSPMIDVVLHAIRQMDHKGYHPDAILLLQPTSPLRTPEHIKRAIDLLKDNDSVVSVLPIPQAYSPHYLMQITKEGFLDFIMPDGPQYTRRQDVPRAMKRDGTIFLTKTSVLIDKKSFYGNRCIPMIMEEKESINIDEQEDWINAERLIIVKTL